MVTVLVNISVAPAQESSFVAGAKKEGKVVLYVSAQLSLAQAISKRFEGKYPFLKLEITRTSGENLLNRIRTEKLAGKILFDVVYSAQPSHPNGARLFADFLLSPEGQRIIFEDRKIPVRSDVIPENSPLHPGGLEIFPGPPKVVTNLSHYAAKFEEIFGPRR